MMRYSSNMNMWAFTNDTSIHKGQEREVGLEIERLKYAYEIMNKDSIIINMASTDGIDTYSIYNTDYAVSKAGIIQLTKSMSLCLQDIKTIALAPNWVDTESTREMNQEYLKKELQRIKQKELIPISKVVNMIIHIIGDKNIPSGSIIRIDGDDNE